MQDIASLPTQRIPVARIHASPFNPRTAQQRAGLPRSPAFADEKLDELAASMRSATGQISAILVRPHPIIPGDYQLADGERRYRAAKRPGSGIDTLIAKVRDLDDAEMVEIALAIGGGSNVEQLTPLEEAAGYSELMKLRGLSERQLAEHIGRERTHVARRLALLSLPAKSAAALQAGQLAPFTAWRIARIPGDAAREQAEKAILEGDLSDRAAADYIAETICRPLAKTPFDLKDADLVPSAGACTNCRFRAGNNPEEYGDVVDLKKGGGADKCMAPACFADKLAAHHKRVLAKVATGGKQPLPSEENDRVFPPTERGLDYRADYVPYNERPTPDILKKEVTSAPTWRELTEGRGVQIYVGVHQDGHGVELVKRDEAIAAADLNERKIFNDGEVKRGTVAKPSGAVGDVAAASRAAVEKAEKAARVKAEKAQRKKDAASATWLRELADELAEGKGRAPWETLVYWTLEYDLAAAQLSPDEVAYVVRAWDQDTPEAERDRAGLDVLAHGMTPRELFALVALMKLAPRIRAGGADCELAKEWHEALLMDVAPGVAGEEQAEEELDPILVGESVEWGPQGRTSRGVVVTAEQAKEITGEDFSEFSGARWLIVITDGENPGDAKMGMALDRTSVRRVVHARKILPITQEDRKRFTEIVKAHEGGMSAIKIARTFGAEIGEVCNLLELKCADVYAERDRLDDDLATAFHAAGVAQGGQAGFITFALGMQAIDRADLAPEEIRAVIAALSRAQTAREPKAVPPDNQPAEPPTL